MIIGQSGEYTITCGGTGTLYITVCWTEYIDIAANTSKLSVTKLIVDGGGRIGRIYINGAIGVNGSVIARLSEESNWADISKMNVPAEEANGTYPYESAPITHDAEGTGLAVLSVQLNGSYPEGGQHYYAVAEIPIGLTDLSRVYITADGETEIGSNMNITISSMCTDYVSTLRYVCGSRSGVIGEGLGLGSYAWTPPMELCYEITDDFLGQCTIYCDGYRNGSLIDNGEVTVDLRVPSHVRLTFESGWLTLQPDNSGTAAEGIDCFVAGKSRVQGVFDDSKVSYDNAYGARIVSCKLVVDGREYDEPYCSDVLLNVGKISMGCSLLDSRGVHYLQVGSKEVYSYALPRIVSASVFRCTEDGTASDSGTCISVTADGRNSSLGGLSVAAVTARLRSMSGTWSERVALKNRRTSVLWAGQVSAQQSYEVEVKVTDTLGGTTALTFTVPTAKVFFHGRAGGEGAAFGKYAEADDLLELAWSLKTKGDLIVEGTAVIGGKTLTDWLYPVGTVCTCSADANPADLFGGTWAVAADTVQRFVRTE